MTAEAEKTLEIDGVSKAFVGNRALDGVCFSVDRGEIHALLGGNGSGKSTLVKILAGVYQADSGHIERQGRRLPCREIKPALARELGLRFVHQSSSAFPSMTVAENFAFGDGFPRFAGKIRWSELHRRTRTVLERYEIPAGPTTPLNELRPADQTMVAIARALADEEEAGDLLLVLDEPTASLPTEEVDIVLAALRRCAARGQSIIYVSHRLDEVLSVADSVTVLRDGKLVVSRPTEGLGESQLIEHIAGRPLERVYRHHEHDPGKKVLLRVNGLAGGPLKDVSLTAREGEVVGVGGLLGTGRTELLRMIFGALPHDAGTIEVLGEKTSIRDPWQAMQRGVAYVPEDRHLDAAFEDLTVRENLSAATLGRYWSHFRFRHDRERSEAAEAIDQFQIQASSDRQPLAQLSGGNQQKVIMSRWLRRAPLLLLLDEPTQGVDVAARADIHGAVRRAVDEGATALVVSSDFEELAQVSDRILILREGRVAAEVQKSHADRDRITELVYSGNPNPA